MGKHVKERQPTNWAQQLRYMRYRLEVWLIQVRAK
jgi:hypothetical protein